MEDGGMKFLQTNTRSLSLDGVQITTYGDLIHNMKTHLPVTYGIFLTCATSYKTLKASTKIRREQVCHHILLVSHVECLQAAMAALGMIEYVQNRTYNCLQKLLAVYFKFHSMTAKAFDTAHTLSITMSMKWTIESVGALVASATKNMLSLQDNCFWLMLHNNLNLAFLVYSQRINNQTHFNSGTAGTIYFKTNEEPISDGLP